MNEKRKRVLGIVGSPRRNGNTEVIVDEVLAGAEESGASIHKVILSELDISPCRACEVCTKTGTCFYQDDMTDLLSLMFESDVWVLGTPVYWWGPTAQFKTFLDRWYGVNERKQFEGKSVILAIPLGGSREYAYGPTIDIMERVMKYLKMKHEETILAPRVMKKGSIRNYPEILIAAKNAGKIVATSHS